MRGLGVTAAVSHAVPQSLVPVLVVLTTVGNPAFVAVLATVGYWLGPRYDLLDRREAATIVAITFVALSVTLFLKAGFSLPRPPPSVMRIAQDGAGFPSGHATGATATYVAFALSLTRGEPRIRYLAASVLVALVAATRVLLGVHYLVDVLAGIAVGLTVVAGVRLVARGSMTWAFALAVPFAVGGGVLHATAEAALQVGLVAGGTIGWWAVRDRVGRHGPTLGSVAAVLVVGALLVGGGYESGIPVVAGFTGAAAGALFVALPGLGAQKVSR